MTADEKHYIRDLAKQKREIAETPEMYKLAAEWTSHNDLCGKRPMIHFEMGTVGDKGFNYECRCTSADARAIEDSLGRSMQNYKMVGDDRVVTADYSVGYGSWIKLFGLDIKHESSGGVGYHIVPVIDNLETTELIQPSFMEYYKDGFAEQCEKLNDLFGDILTIRPSMGSLYCTPTNNLVQLMSMENMFVSMYDNPDNFHAMMEQLTVDYIKYFHGLETRGMLLPCCGNDWLSQGSFAFTNDLPHTKNTPFVLGDVWGYMDSQETVGISAEMFHEFFFPYYMRISELFGLLSYGCCEPVHSFWESSISKFKNLRKVSISPWCDEEYMGNQLRNSNIIYLRKPSPLFIGGTEKELDEDGFRSHIRKTMKAACACKLEFAFRDVYTLNGNLDKPRRAVEIIREETESNWI